MPKASGKPQKKFEG